VIGVAPQRRLPAFAPQTFQEWFRRRDGATGRRGDGATGRSNEDATSPRPPVPLSPCLPVVLWPDTFYNHFFPEVCQAAVEVLEAAGFEVMVPGVPPLGGPDLCCGRPLYDYGMLDTAKAWLRQILEALRPQIEAGVPVVGLEPSCVSIFREELTNLFPNEMNAMRLRNQTFTLSEFLERNAPDFRLPELHGKAVVHGHCHHKAIMKMDAEEAILRKLGLEVELLDSGCCGMAGAFGMEKGEHYEVSMKVGERVLLPAVRSAPKDTLIIADGFSCREQIAQTTDRRALHLAQVLQRALRGGEVSGEEYPERRYSPNGWKSREAVGAGPTPLRGVAVAAAMGAAALLAGSVAVWALNKRRAG
jgi:Fe-S oxidoreductase